MISTRRRTKFTTFLLGLRKYSADQLIEMLNEKHHAPLLRCAALRWLISAAPLEITQGAPYGERRRYVRRHHHI